MNISSDFEHFGSVVLWHLRLSLRINAAGVCLCACVCFFSFLFSFLWHVTNECNEICNNFSLFFFALCFYTLKACSLSHACFSHIRVHTCTLPIAVLKYAFEIFFSTQAFVIQMTHATAFKCIYIRAAL